MDSEFGTGVSGAKERVFKAWAVVIDLYTTEAHCRRNRGVTNYKFFNGKATVKGFVAFTLESRSVWDLFS